jgi:hypothetical protein
MNSNPPTPNPFHADDAFAMNEAVMQKLKSYRWKSRALAAIALSLGLLSIAAGIFIAWANAIMIMPMERLLLEDYPLAVRQASTNSPGPLNREGKPTLSQAQLDVRHVQVTAAHGKVLILMAVSIGLLGMGTFVTLLLVIFNRRVTLRQLNASLAQISIQIKEWQDGKGSGR